MPSPAKLNRILQITFMPSLVLVALLTMYARTTVVMKAVEHGDVSGMFAPAPAVAQPAPEASKPTDKLAADKAATDKPATDKPATADANAKEAAGGDETSQASKGDSVDNLTSEDVAILQQLAQRRAALDTRAGQLDQKEALLQATEKRLDDKMAQLQTTRGQLQQMLGQADEQQQAQTASMVKIYESMKPAQAAAIIAQLDMPIALQVLSKMKEAKAAPVLAAMDPARAKTITTALMQKKDLPKLDPATATMPAPSGKTN